MARLSWLGGKICLIACFCLIVTRSTASFGWGTLTHCTIGEKTGTGPGYNNVPDYWPSMRGFFIISPYFCWTHECKVTAGKEVSWRRRVKPDYNFNIGAEDDNPSHYMDILLSKKMDSNKVTTSMQTVILGWKAHNAADQVVHYDLFPGGDPGDRRLTIIRKWRRHKRWEPAADKLVHVEILHEGNEDAAFDRRGRAVPHDFGPLDCGDDDSDGFLCLAQKVFRKKQATLDVHVMWGLSVQSRRRIGGLRRGRIERDLRRLFNFSRSDYDDALQIPEIANWEQFFNQSVQAVNAVK